VYFNLHPDHFFGYRHGHAVETVFSYEAPSVSDVMALANEAYGAFNAPDLPRIFRTAILVTNSCCKLSVWVRVVGLQ
jgi:hypothetical protein